MCRVESTAKTEAEIRLMQHWKLKEPRKDAGN
jgi:hypothetical protein